MSSTYHYDCQGCGSHDELSAAGGALSCTCDKPSGDDLFVTLYLDGKREWQKTMSAVCGLSTWVGK